MSETDNNDGNDRPEPPKPAPKKPPFYLIDTSHEFYRPLWRRWLIVAMGLSWLGIELIARDPFWMVLSGATALYVVYTLIIAYRPPDSGA